MRVQYLVMNKYIPLVSCVSNLFTTLHCLLKCLQWILAVYIQVWDQNSLRYGVRSQVFFDVVSIALRLAPTRDDSFSGMESLILIALSCDPKLSPAGQQAAKHDELYPLLSVSLTVPPFVECFQQRNDPCTAKTLGLLQQHF